MRSNNITGFLVQFLNGLVFCTVETNNLLK